MFPILYLCADQTGTRFAQPQLADQLCKSPLTPVLHVAHGIRSHGAGAPKHRFGNTYQQCPAWQWELSGSDATTATTK